MRTVLKLSLFGVFVATAARADELPKCSGCEALVELADTDSDALLGALRITQSMPLDGTVIHWRPDAGSSIHRRKYFVGSVTINSKPARHIANDTEDSSAIICRDYKP